MNNAATILHPMIEALRPPRRMLPSAWAEASLVLPRESNARAGKLRLTAAQKGMADAAAEPGTRELVLMTSAQCGKTTALHAILGWAACGEGGPLLIVRPDEGDVAAYTRETLDPLISASPALRNIIGATDNKNLKTYAGGSIALASSFKASALAGKSIRMALFDELDRATPVVSSGEGRPEDLVRRRLHTFRKSLLLLASTPTFAQTSRIAANYERGDKRLFFVACRHCGEWEPITEARLHVEPGKPEDARLLCPQCGALAGESERLRMIETGEWRASARGEPGVVSMHINELASEFSSLQKVAAQVDSAKSLEERKSVCNLVWGLPFEATSEVENDAGELSSRAEPIIAPYDKRIDHVTAGVDCQGNRLEVMFLGTAANAERWILDRVVIPGDTSGEAPWRALGDVLSTTFKLEDKRELPISVTFIDAGFNTENVAKFCAAMRQRQRRIWPSFGRAGWDKPAVKEGSKVKGLMRGLIIGVDNLKLNTMKSLTIRDGGPNAIHLPAHLDDDFFAQLASERLTVKYVKGYARHQWEKDPTTRNEALDILVLATAASGLVKGRAAPVNKPKGDKPSLATRFAALNGAA